MEISQTEAKHEAEVKTSKKIQGGDREQKSMASS